MFSAPAQGLRVTSAMLPADRAGPDRRTALAPGPVSEGGLFSDAPLKKREAVLGDATLCHARDKEIC